MLERAALLSDHLVLDAREIHAAIGTLIALPKAVKPKTETPDIETFSAARERFDRQLIETTLAHCNGNVIKTAQQLGLGRSSCTKRWPR